VITFFIVTMRMIIKLAKAKFISMGLQFLWYTILISIR